MNCHTILIRYIFYPSLFREDPIMGITLQQIADLAGTTKSTVDKVIHNRPGVSEKKRQEIKKLLEEYGYEANPLAKALNYQKRKMKVAVVLPNISAAPDIKKGFEIVRQDFQSIKQDLPLMLNLKMVVHLKQLKNINGW